MPNNQKSAGFPVDFFFSLHLAAFAACGEKVKFVFRSDTCAPENTSQSASVRA